MDLDNGWRNSQSNIHLTNGTLTVTGLYEFYGDSTENAVWNGATFTIAPTVAYCYEGRSNAGCPVWSVKAGGTLNMLADTLSMFCSAHTVEAGGTLRLEPKKVRWNSTSNWPNRYCNSGTLVMTNGFDMTGSSEPNDSGSSLGKNHAWRRYGWANYVSFDHLGGTFMMGGRFSNGGLSDGGYFLTWQNACTVEVVKDLSFVGFDCAVSNNAQVALSVAEGSAADLSTFYFGDNTTVTKTGAGTLLVSSAHPTALDVQEGVLELTEAEPDFTGVTFADGTAVTFGYNGTMRIDALADFADRDFFVDTNRVAVGTAFFVSSSAARCSSVTRRTARRVISSSRRTAAASTRTTSRRPTRATGRSSRSPRRRPAGA